MKLTLESLAEMEQRLDRAESIPTLPTVRAALHDARDLLLTCQRSIQTGRRKRRGAQQGPETLARWAARRAEIAAHYDASQDVTATAQAFGLSPQRVYGVLRRERPHFATAMDRRAAERERQRTARAAEIESRRKESAARRAEIIAYSDAEGIEAAARKYGVTRKAVYDFRCRERLSA